MIYNKNNFTAKSYKLFQLYDKKLLYLFEKSQKLENIYNKRLSFSMKSVNRILWQKFTILQQELAI